MLLQNINVTIDGKQVSVPKGTTVLQACETANVVVPRFCYHERLSIAGNCRMCLVEVAKSPKLVASCAMPVAEGMDVKTNSNLVKKAREGILELLLINHPLDCPICDQGGECDLQDQAMSFGSDRSRFNGVKRAVKDKDVGPLVKTIMTRCIHCTRCVRFGKEIAGIADLGTSGRGMNMEIGTYVQKVFNSELSGNVIDLCPVGALTSKPYSFVARSWELKSTETIDVFDSIGSNIKMDTRGYEILRVVPAVNESINEEWITDKVRFSYDGFKRQRLNVPMVRNIIGENSDSILKPTTWLEAFNIIKQKIKTIDSSEIVGIHGPFVSAESLLVFKEFFNRLGSRRILTSFSANKDLHKCTVNNLTDLRSNYIFNTTLSGVESADACLLIGTNPRKEAPLLNLRLRKRFLKGSFIVGSIGAPVDLTFETVSLGNSFQTLADIAKGNHFFCKVLNTAKKPLIIINSDLLSSSEGTAIWNSLQTIIKNTNIISDNWNGLNVLQSTASGCSSFDLNVPSHFSFNSLKNKEIPAKILYLLGSDEINIKTIIKEASPDCFIIYQGHHGDLGASFADVVLPSFSFVESEGLYLNTEGRPQFAHPVVKGLGNAKADWLILRALSEVLGITLPYNSIKSVRERLYELVPAMELTGQIIDNNVKLVCYHNSGHMSTNLFKPLLNNFYMTDVVTRASHIMARCTSVFNSNFLNFKKA
uniref:NADH dehydrogenase subunit 11 n=1 Tax=Palpitomonas bilix TaxID=652834 RepID=A0A1E1GHP7_9EUKA|nr:NADH dehydrogenase subunit 11 [Palpitomonas bilix]YP_009317267.1 NADH dehydrogenase subunit 11 [Palpitomonas bilix]BAV82386.1 NADH dehydrogenase subunit 11 [Palpitomonas bilix]BAV82435.1 NADH dehydrogenase subunit 11 [Palpitomonas bilix]